MVGRLSEKNYFTRNYHVKRQDEGPEEVIVPADQAFEILDGFTDSEDIVMLDQAYAQFNIDGGSSYRGAGYLKFGETDGPIEAELHTQSDNPREGLGRGMLSISVLPREMDPNRVGRNPLV